MNVFNLNPLLRWLQTILERSANYCIFIGMLQKQCHLHCVGLVRITICQGNNLHEAEPITSIRPLYRAC